MTDIEAILIGAVVVGSVGLTMVAIEALFVSVSHLIGSQRITFILFFGIAGCIAGFSIHQIVTGRIINSLDSIISSFPL